MREHGCYKDLSNEDYHADKDYVSRSALMDFDKSPYTYWAKHLNPDRPKKEATPQMQMGSAFHTLMLEPHLFYQQYAVETAKVLLKDAGREAYDAYKKECEELERTGKIVLSRNEWFVLAAMSSKMQANEQAMQLISDARIENSFFWQDAESGMLVKARPDILHENMIVDLKTCADASPRAIQNAMASGGYHIQGAMIRDAVEAIEGRRINTVINICIENNYPHNMGIYIIEEPSIDAGEQKYKDILLALKNAIVYNDFTDYGTKAIGLPRWAT